MSVFLPNRHLSRALVILVCCGPPTTVNAQDGTGNDRAAGLIKDLQASNVEVRRGAANQVRLADRNLQRQALPVLIELLLKEKDGQVRLATLDAVTTLGADAESAIPALVQTLRTSYGGSSMEESHQDYRSALALAAVGKPAVDGLRSVLQERKENVRAEAIMALGRIGPDSAPAVADLIPLLGDKSERIRREAATALGRIGTAATRSLIVAASDQGNLGRVRAIESLGQLAAPDDQVAAVVLKSAEDANPLVRAEALRSLTHVPLSAEALLPVLKANLRDKDANVRLAAVNLLVERRTLLPGMAADLGVLLLAEDEGVARHAAFLLRKLGPDGAPILIHALADERSRIDQIGEALAGIGRPVVPLLEHAIEAADHRVRRGAALAFGQIRPLPPATVPRLMVGLHDSDQATRADYLAAIVFLGPRGSEAVPTVRSLLQDSSADIRLRVINILAQSAPRDDQLLTDLTTLIDDPDPAVQGRAVDILRSLGPMGRKALSRVVGVLDSPNAAVRLSSAEFIESHGNAAVEAIPALTVLLKDPLPKIRITAAQTLGKLGKPAQPAFVALAALLGDDRAEVREVAALSLGNLELDAETVQLPLAQALRDAKNEVRRAAMKSIQRLGPQGAILIPDIIPLAATKENVRAVDRLLRSYERTGPDVRSLPDLVKLLDHDQVAVRLLAIKFLGLAGPNAREVLPALERISADPNADVRQQVKTACEQIKNEPTAAPEKSRAAN